MKVATRVVFNTIVLYLKIVVSMAIALVSVPLVLKSLGTSDYGLYNVVAGVVGMLSFLNNSMTVSSQRYMSVAMGTKDSCRVENVYNASFRIHVILGVAVVLLLEIGSFFIGELNIEPERIRVAHSLYQFLILSTFVKIIGVPFDALINAKEDMLVFSIIGIVESALMLLVAISLQYISWDKLVFYGIGIALISIICIILTFCWTKYAYRDLKLRFYVKGDSSLIKEMFGFAGWNLFGGFAVMGRNQGVAVIINMFLGTTANAAYGVANQINGALLNFSSTFQKAINPQLMRSEGMNNRERLHRISFVSSKFSVLALCFFAVPLIIEMQEVLNVWLRSNIPPYTLRLSQLILLFSIIFQYSNGLMSAIQATGNIRNYQLIMGVIILMNLPVSYFVLNIGLPVYYVTFGYVVLELISLFVRIIMAHRITGMNVSDYIQNVLKPTIIIIGISTVVALLPHYLLAEGLFRLFFVCGLYCIFYMVLMWFYAFDNSQRNLIKDYITNKIKYIRV